MAPRLTKLNSPSVDKGRILSTEEEQLLAYPLRLEMAPLDPGAERHEVPVQGHCGQIRDFKQKGLCGPTT